MIKDRTLFNYIDFPSEIYNEFIKLPNNYTEDDHYIRSDQIDLNLMEKHAKLWNPYAKEHGFLTIGTIYTSNCNSNPYVGCVHMIIGILPKGIIGKKLCEDEYENHYITIRLYDKRYIDTLVGIDFDEASFLKTTKFFRYHDLNSNGCKILDNNYFNFIKLIKEKLVNITERLKDNAVLTYTIHEYAQQSYHLTKIDKVYYTLTKNAYTVFSNDKPIELYIGNSAGTYTYFCWKIKNNWSSVQCYVYENEHQQLKTDFISSTRGFIINLKTSSYTFDKVKKMLTNCDGIYEDIKNDPFKEYFIKLQKAKL